MVAVSFLIEYSICIQKNYVQTVSISFFVLLTIICNKMTNKCLILVLLAIFAGELSAQKISQKDWKPIEEMLKQQETAWNRGDIDGFMEPYWKSDSLRFIGKKGITYGWQNTLQNYQKSYPDPETMGKLAFTILHTEQLSPTVITMTGKWSLARTKQENLSGYFSLLWKKLKGKWQIVSDHSS